MALPTAAIGLLPTHAQIGIAAPLLLSGLRLIQGFAVGGEFPSTMAYLAEIAPSGRRGFLASFAMCGVLVGLLIANLITLGTSSLLTPGEMAAWGWRVPFLLAFGLAAIVLVMRLSLTETPVFLERREAAGTTLNPIVSALTERPAEIAKVFLFLIFNAIAFNTVMMFATTYLSKTAGFTYPAALTISLVGAFAMLVLVPLGGHVSDRIGRRRGVGIGALLCLVLAYPVYLAFNQGSFGLALAAQLAIVVTLALHVGPIPALIAEQFGTDHRLTGASIAFNLSITLIGGTAPLFNELLVQRTDWAEAPSLYLMAGALVTLVALLLLRETAGRRL